MSHNSDSYEVARSFEVFTDPKSYKQFDLTKDHMRMVGCIDPRDEQDDDLKVIMQTAGGAVGKGHDAALAHKPKVSGISCVLFQWNKALSVFC